MELLPQLESRLIRMFQTMYKSCNHILSFISHRALADYMCFFGRNLCHICVKYGIVDICNKACLYKFKELNISDLECLPSQCVKELIECRDGTACCSPASGGVILVLSCDMTNCIIFHIFHFFLATVASMCIHFCTIMYYVYLYRYVSL